MSLVVVSGNPSIVARGPRKAWVTGQLQGHTAQHAKENQRVPILVRTFVRDLFGIDTRIMALGSNDDALAISSPVVPD